MIDLKNNYEKIEKQRQSILEEISTLENSEVVKRYIELLELDENLRQEQVKLYKSIKLESYQSCDHILIGSKIDYGCYEGRTFPRYGCIKCGLDSGVLSLDKQSLSMDQKVMYDYLSKTSIDGKQIEVVCDLDLAQAIYSKIKESNPEIDDKTATKYFEIALDNIRNIKVSDERQVDRAKRLKLPSNFSNWNI